MLNLNEPVVIRGYCGILMEYETSMNWSEECLFNITLRDRFDPRITIVMEDIHANEIFKNTCP